MSLARVKTWIPGDVLTAADLNAEFNNILNNPVSLISPSTGAINFNLQAHTGILPSAITATSGSAGQVLTKVGTATVWGNAGSGGLTTGTPSTGDLLVFSSNAVWVPLVQGSTGTVLAVTSSGVSPSYQVIPPDGGLSTGSPSTGALYYISTDGKYVPLAIGTSGQVLTVSTASKPSWAAATATGGGSGGFASTTVTLFDDFTNIISNAAGLAVSGAFPYASTGTGGAAFTYLSTVHTVTVPTASDTVSLFISSALSTPRLIWTTTMNPNMTVVYSHGSTSSTIRTRIGLCESALSTENANEIIVRSSGGVGSTNYLIVSRNAGAEFTLNTSTVISSASHAFNVTVTGGGTAATATVDGVSVGSFTSSQLPAAGTYLTFGFGSSVTAIANYLHVDGWSVAADRSALI